MPAPSLSVRAFAELIDLPAYDYERILHEQKYPRQQPQKFRTPYYSPALTGIREFYRSGNDRAVLLARQHAVSAIVEEVRRRHNTRVLNDFASGKQARRSLTLAPNPRRIATFGQVQLRLSLDMIAIDQAVVVAVYYHCRASRLDREFARTSLELAHWVMEQNRVVMPIGQLEFIDVSGSRVHRTGRRRLSTIKQARKVAKVVEALWPGI